VQAQEPISTEFARLMLQHGADHDNALAQKGDKNLNQVRASMQPLIQFLSQVAQSDAQGQLPSNVLPGPNSTQPGGPGLSAGGDQASGSTDPIKDATSVLNALASLKKANVPITDLEVNVALAAAGLPPLSTGQPIPEPIPPPSAPPTQPIPQQGVGP
jgi:hypothetical protein